uniref:Uncharacterized protein n=1 Tax=Amphimedon queenslandica TaxID=400682 RepID=A0A1X7UYP7_AMPQE
MAEGRSDGQVVVSPPKREDSNLMANQGLSWQKRVLLIWLQKALCLKTQFLTTLRQRILFMAGWPFNPIQMILFQVIFTPATILKRLCGYVNLYWRLINSLISLTLPSLSILLYWDSCIFIVKN